MDIQLVILVVAAMGAVIAYWAFKEDKQNKEIQRLIDRTIDRDNDGWIFEGTPMEQYRGPKKAVAKKKLVKKAAVKKKSAPAKKKKAVAKKKSR